MLSDRARQGFDIKNTSTYWLVLCYNKELTDVDAEYKCFQNSPDVRNNTLLRNASRSDLRAIYPTDPDTNRFAD